jgi:RNA polymerase sigma factor (sigma-70 family)
VPKHQAPQTRQSMLGRLRTVPIDQQAWIGFIDRYGPSIHAWCLEWRLPNEDAADVTQQVLTHLVVRLRSFEYDSTKSFRKWLWTVARHAWADFVNARERPGRGSGSERINDFLNRLSARDDLLSRLATAFDLELYEETAARVRIRVQSKTWEAYHRTAILGQSGQEVAAALGMTIANVFVAKSSVLKLIRTEIYKLEKDGKSEAES